MPDRPSQLPFDIDEIPLTATLAPGDADASSRRAQRDRALSQILGISGGAFLFAGALTWLMTNYVFVEKVEDESTLELPQTRMQTMVFELPLARVRQEKNLPGDMGKKHETVFILEIDASIIVHGTMNELLGMQTMLRAYQNRIEQAIDQTIRSATPAELDEPEAKTLRDRIRQQVNEFYGEPVAKEVIFSHYRAFHTPIKR